MALGDLIPILSADPATQDGGYMSEQEIKRKRALADALLKEGSNYSPVQHWTQGAARLAAALNGGLQDYRLRSEEHRGRADESRVLASLIPGMSGGRTTPATTPATPSAAPSGDASAPAKPGDAGGMTGYQNAIASIESGGNYGAMGPKTKTGDRAYGKYQIMGANIPQWTQAALGQAMTPQQFLASKEAQDATFNHRFGGYVDKYGPADAASMWFSGRPLAKAGNASDALGMTTPRYVKRFMAALGPNGGQELRPVKVASADPSAMAYAATGGAPSPAQAAIGAAMDVSANPNLVTDEDLTGAQSPFGGLPSHSMFDPTKVASNAPVAPGPSLDVPKKDSGLITDADIAPGPAKIAASDAAATPAPAAAAAPTRSTGDMAKINAAMQLIRNPYSSPASRQIAGMILQQAMKGDEVSTVDLGNAIGVMDKRGNLLRTIQKQKEATPDWEVVKDDQQRPIGSFNKRTNEFKPIGGGIPATAGGAQITTSEGVKIPIPAGIDEKEFRKKIADKEAQKIGDAPGAYRKAGEGIDLIDTMLKHPGLNSSTGWGGIIPNGLPGSNMRAFIAMHDQLKGKAFLQAFENLKGGGQITEVEGKKATDAIARLDRAQSTKDYMTALNDLRSVLDAARKRLAKIPGATGAPGAPETEPVKKLDDPLGIR